jgi:hypothetical protein
MLINKIYILLNFMKKKYFVAVTFGQTYEHGRFCRVSACKKKSTFTQRKERLVILNCSHPVKKVSLFLRNLDAFLVYNPSIRRPHCILYRLQGFIDLYVKTKKKMSDP